MIARWSVSISLMTLLTGSAISQTVPAPAAASVSSEPAELAQKRQQFMTRALSGSQLLSEQFAKALGSLAREAGASGNYELALKAQQRRENLAALYSSALEGSGISNVLIMRAADARVGGSVNYDRSKDVLVGWKTVGNSAYWDVSRITAGSYDVQITYGVAELGDLPSRPNPYLAAPDLTTGGDFEFFEDSSLSGAAANRRTGTVTSTGGWTEFSTLTLPAVQLTRSNARFTLKITRAKGEGGVMHLKEIRLTPAKPATAETSAPVLDENGQPLPQVDELTKLKQDHLERLRQKLTPISFDYTGKLNSLAATLTSNADAVEELLNEVKRVERLGDNPRSLLQLRDRSRPAAAGALADGMHEMRDAVYVAAPENTGDRFQVACNGETFPVRLLWVSCPLPGPATPGSPAADAAGYFGLSEEDTIAVGIMARDFTAEYLKDKPLRLVTRGLKDADGALLVSVQPEGLGDFAGALVDNGLAMVHQPAARARAAKLHEDTALTVLRERETAARTRHIPPGAWSRAADANPATPGT
jgi:endonuclease YncB( thermonuclease family)